MTDRDEDYEKMARAMGGELPPAPTYTDQNIITSGRHAGLVRRYHVWGSMHAAQSVGEHTWQMYRIYREIWGRPPADVTEYLMLHDTGEIAGGDVPLYGKRDVPELKPLHDRAEEQAQVRLGMIMPKIAPLEGWRVKATDLIEGVEHACLEIQMGSRLAIPILQNYLRAVAFHIQKIWALSVEGGGQQLTSTLQADVDVLKRHLSDQLEEHQLIMLAPVSAELPT